jgi:hypothetical protein
VKAPDFSRGRAGFSRLEEVILFSWALAPAIMSSSAPQYGLQQATNSRLLGRAWVALTIALAVHVTDEALTGFLSVYNPTVLAIRETFPNFPMPIFTFRVWLGGLIGLIVILFSLSPLAFRGARWIRYVAWPLALIMLLNAAGHTLGTIFGQTVSSVQFPRPMPGFYSSPLLAVASLFLMWSLRKTGADTRSS